MFDFSTLSGKTIKEVAVEKYCFMRDPDRHLERVTIFFEDGESIKLSPTLDNPYGSLRAFMAIESKIVK